MVTAWERLRRRLQRPVVSVVVPVYNVEDYLAECLDSLLGQTLEAIEVIAVDDGSFDGSSTILRQYAARDRRVQVLTQANAGQGAARNAGVAVARGEFVMFVDSDDVLPLDALAEMVTTLRRTGSDFCLGAAQRFTHRRSLEVAWGASVHDRDRLATTIDAFPDAMHDIIACNRLFRTAFWRERVPPFEPGVAYEDHVPMLAAYLRADRFDVLARVVYRWRIRSDSSSTSQQKAALRNLQDRIAVKEEARRMVTAEASPQVYDAWVARTIDIDFQQFLRFALSASDEYRLTLQGALQTMFGLASTAALDRIKVAPKVRGWLGSQGAWDALEDAEEWFRRNGPLPTAQVQGDRLVAVPDPEATFLTQVPDRLYALAPHETPLAAVLRRAVWAAAGDDAELQLEGYALVRGLDATDRPPEMAAWLEPERGEPMPLELTVGVDPWIDSWAGDPSVSYRHGRFALRVPVRTLAAGGAGRWHLRLRLSCGALVREDGVHSALDGSAVTRLEVLRLGTTSVSTSFDPEGFTVTVAAGPPAEVAAPERWLGVHDVDLADDKAVVEVEARGLAADALAAAVLRGDELDVPALAVEPAGGAASQGRWRLFFPMTADRWGHDLVVPRGGYRLVADGVVAQPAGSLLGDLPRAQLSTGLRLTARVRPNGALALLVAAPLTDEERSPADQHRLRVRPAGPVDESLVLLQCGPSGDVIDGDPLAIDQAIARLRPQLRRVWGVRYGGVLAPAGAETVTVGSARWHELVRTAGTLITDDDLGEWFRRSPGQRWVQTFRGHPAKSMGAGHQRSQGLTPGRIARLGARYDAEWTTVVAPSPVAEKLYRDALGYHGEILTVGAPRTDPLLAADREAARNAARRRLGLAPETTAVLYAPTYRDAQVNRVRSAVLPRTLDLDAIAALPDTAVLLRAHPHDAVEAAAWARSTAASDVTEYPRVADLLLAADVAVLDYSALRFDWALTGKPAICFVPDLEIQRLRRPTLLPYEETAPGPLATTSAEVVALLEDVPALAAASAPLAAAVAERFASLCDGAAADRVVATLFPAQH